MPAPDSHPSPAAAQDCAWKNVLLAVSRPAHLLSWPAPDPVSVPRQWAVGLASQKHCGLFVWGPGLPEDMPGCLCSVPEARGMEQAQGDLSQEAERHSGRQVLVSLSGSFPSVHVFDVGFQILSFCLSPPVRTCSKVEEAHGSSEIEAESASSIQAPCSCLNASATGTQSRCLRGGHCRAGPSSSMPLVSLSGDIKSIHISVLSSPASMLKGRNQMAMCVALVALMSLKAKPPSPGHAGESQFPFPLGCPFLLLLNNGVHGGARGT